MADLCQLYETPFLADPPIRRTAQVVRYLASQPDQTAGYYAIADGIMCSGVVVLEALRLLRNKGRVAEIHPGVWHLE